MEQALIGPSPNPLILSYLKYAVNSQVRKGNVLRVYQTNEATVMFYLPLCEPRPLSDSDGVLFQRARSHQQGNGMSPTGSRADRAFDSYMCSVSVPVV